LYAIGSGTTVAVYTNADTATGDLAPTRTITGFAGLQGIAIDSANDRLYVSNANTIWIIDNASMINGAVGTVRTVTGGSSFAFLSLDVANNRLFTGEGTNYRVNVFDNASTMNGTYAATVSRTIIGPATLLNTPRAVYYHPATDKLYVASYGSNSIQVFANAGSASGNVAPAQNLSGSSTTLLQPYAVLVNGATNELVVANNGSSGLRIYANADTVTGNTAPTRSVSGTSTNITSVRSLLLDPNR
jgi:DNA-binding beta-propeller fold protein YncE